MKYSLSEIRLIGAKAKTLSKRCMGRIIKRAILGDNLSTTDREVFIRACNNKDFANCPSVFISNKGVPHICKVQIINSYPEKCIYIGESQSVPCSFEDTVNHDYFLISKLGSINLFSCLLPHKIQEVYA